jgi:hypothetical protein
MKILNGRWVNEFDEPLTIFEAAEIKPLGERVKAVFGENNITHERIKIVNRLSSIDTTSERVISNVLDNNELMSKLAGI